MKEKKLTDSFKVLCVDDETEILEIYEEIVKSKGYEPILASNADEAFELVEKFHDEIIMILSDYKMPGKSGLEFRALCLPEYQDIPFAIVSGFITREMALKGIENKICAFLDKATELESFGQVIDAEAKSRLESLKEDIELRSCFIDESTQLLEELESHILSLDNSSGDLDVLNRIFGILHTIKGTSAFFKPDTIHKFSHKFEDYISSLRTEGLDIDDVVISILFKASETLSSLIEGLKTKSIDQFELETLLEVFSKKQKAQKKEKKSESGEKQENKNEKILAKSKDWVKAPLELLDRFMKLSGDITVIRNMINKTVEIVDRRYSGDTDLKELEELLEEMHQVNSKMQGEVLELRKVSLSEVYRPIMRTVRNLSASLNKEVRLEVEGEKLRVDTSLIEVLSGSVIHMIRNCLDHGIEPPEEREREGKNRFGTIRLSCEEGREEIKFLISDDGRGMDVEKIKNKLIEKELYSKEELEKMNPKKVLEKIFDPGFSTAEKVTDVSGRGIGMDQVKTSVEKAGGEIEVDSKLSQGTRILISLPIPKSVQIVTSLNVEVGSYHYAIPRENIERLLKLDRNERMKKVRNVHGGLSLCWENGALVPLVSLRKVLGFPERNVVNSDELFSVVVVHSKNGIYGVVVDCILDVEETVVKPLPEYLKADGIFLATTFQKSGLPGLILDVEGIASRCQLLADLDSRDEPLSSTQLAEGSRDESTVDYLLFTLPNGKKYAIQLGLISRLERLRTSQIENSAGIKVVRYNNEIMPIFHLEDLLRLSCTTKPPLNEREAVFVIVVRQTEHFFAFVVDEILDIQSVTQGVDQSVRDRPGILGNVVLENEVVVILDVQGLLLQRFSEFNSKQGQGAQKFSILQS